MASYQNKIVANKLLFWISIGFRLHYFDLIIRIESSNLISVRQHPRKTMKKCQRNRIRYVWDTLWEIAFSNLTVSPKGVFPKGDDAGRRLIAYLSFPTGNSIIEFIDPADSTVHNSSIGPVIHMLAKVGKEVCIARWILSHLSDCYLFISEVLNKRWLKWKECVALTSAPMGCFISCKVFLKSLLYIFAIGCRSEDKLFHYWPIISETLSFLGKTLTWGKKLTKYTNR